VTCGDSRHTLNGVQHARSQWVIYSTLVVFLDSNESVMPWDPLIKHDFKPHWVQVGPYMRPHRIGKKPIKS